LAEVGTHEGRVSHTDSQITSAGVGILQAKEKLFCNRVHAREKVAHTRLSQIGLIVQETWIDLPARFEGLVLSEFVIMPNHFHGIVTFTGGPSSKGTVNAFSLPDVLRAFKSISTVHTNRALRISRTQLWQRSFHDHVIRDGEDMRVHQRYILENPQKWEWDEENPERVAAKEKPGP
jgi:putative transposase